jgi:hypothetical protein
MAQGKYVVWYRGVRSTWVIGSYHTRLQAVCSRMFNGWGSTCIAVRGTQPVWPPYDDGM